MVASIVRSKKGFQLSINMLVVIILGIALLGVGFSIFSNAFSKTTDLREQVGEDTQRQINALMDDGSLVVVPYSNKEADRGDYVDFNLGINNEMGDLRSFKVLVTYGGSTAYPERSEDPFNPETDLFLGGSNNHIQSCGYHMGENDDQERQDTELSSECGDSWVLIGQDTFTIKNNEHEYIPIRIVVPEENVKDGQYIFNVDVCENDPDSEDVAICTQGSDGGIENRYDTRHKLYVQIT